MAFIDTRVTSRTLANKSLQGLNANQAKLSRLQEQVSSGKVLTRPSDNPGGAVSALQLRSEIQRNDQYSRNSQDGIGWLGTIDSTLTGMNDSLRRVRDLTLQGMSTGAQDQDSRNALAAEVDALREGLLASANTTYLGRPVFGGTTTGSIAYDTNATFVGDENTVLRTVGANSTVAVNVSGLAVFGDPTDTANGGDLFAVLTQLSDDLRNNPGGLGADLTNLDTASKRVVTTLSDVGARYKRVEQMQSGADNRVLDLKSTLSNIEDVDLPKTLMEVALQSAAYQAALNATSKTVQPSLMDFLR